MPQASAAGTRGRHRHERARAPPPRFDGDAKPPTGSPPPPPYGASGHVAAGVAAEAARSLSSIFDSVAQHAYSQSPLPLAATGAEARGAPGHARFAAALQPRERDGYSYQGGHVPHAARRAAAEAAAAATLLQAAWRGARLRLAIMRAVRGEGETVSTRTLAMHEVLS